MEDLGMSYVYSEIDQHKDKWMKYQDEHVLCQIGGKFLAELLVTPNPVTVKIERVDEPCGYTERRVTFRLHVRHVQSMTVRIPEVPKLEDMPTRFVAWNYKQELIRRFKRFLHRSLHGDKR